VRVEEVVGDVEVLVVVILEMLVLNALCSC
jgi:hypothetical protein